MGFVLSYLIIILEMTSLTCVDSKGCLKHYCAEYKFLQGYKDLIDTSVSKNPDCRYIRGNEPDRKIVSTI